jgi:glycosyltransferase involved in cell wall biosynthesis
MVGTIEPRKGHAQTLAAFEKLWSDGGDANLVIVGRKGWGMDKLAEAMRHHPEHGRRLFWLEGISDEYLEKVYAASTSLIAASYGEGFGLPLIEAAQHKLPIIARALPVFREVAGEHAFYFNGKEPQDLARAVREWMMLYQSDKNPRSEGMPWLTWKQSSQQLMDLILKEQWQYRLDNWK